MQHRLGYTACSPAFSRLQSEILSADIVFRSGGILDLPDMWEDSEDLRVSAETTLSTGKSYIATLFRAELESIIKQLGDDRVVSILQSLYLGLNLAALHIHAIVIAYTEYKHNVVVDWEPWKNLIGSVFQFKNKKEQSQLLRVIVDFVCSNTSRDAEVLSRVSGMLGDARLMHKRAQVPAFVLLAMLYNRGCSHLGTLAEEVNIADSPILKVLFTIFGAPIYKEGARFRKLVKLIFNVCSLEIRADDVLDLLYKTLTVGELQVKFAVIDDKPAKANPMASAASTASTEISYDVDAAEKDLTFSGDESRESVSWFDGFKPTFANDVAILVILPRAHVGSLDSFDSAQIRIKGFNYDFRYIETNSATELKEYGLEKLRQAILTVLSKRKNDDPRKVRRAFTRQTCILTNCLVDSVHFSDTTAVIGRQTTLALSSKDYSHVLRFSSDEQIIARGGSVNPFVLVFRAGVQEKLLAVGLDASSIGVLDKWTSPESLFTYWENLLKLPEHERICAIGLMESFIKSLCSSRPERSFFSVRYDFAKQPQLAGVFADNDDPRFTSWVNGRDQIPLQTLVDKYRPIIDTANEKTFDIKEYLDNSLFAHGHLDKKVQFILAPILVALAEGKLEEVDAIMAELSKDSDPYKSLAYNIAKIYQLIFHKSHAEIHDQKMLSKIWKMVNTILDASISTVSIRELDYREALGSDFEVVSNYLCTAKPESGASSDKDFILDDYAQNKTILITADPELMLNTGHHVTGSCQDFLGSPDLCKSLLNYILSGHILQVAILDEDGTIDDRALVKYMFNEEDPLGAIYLEEVYPKTVNTRVNILLRLFAEEFAATIGCPLVYKDQDITGFKYPGTLSVVVPFGWEYSDANHGQMKAGSPYEVQDVTISTLINPAPIRLIGETSGADCSVINKEQAAKEMYLKVVSAIPDTFAGKTDEDAAGSSRTIAAARGKMVAGEPLLYSSNQAHQGGVYSDDELDRVVAAEEELKIRSASPSNRV